MIEFENVTVVAAAARILDKVSFCLYRGEKLVITGPTGCGKSTVITTLLGAYRPSSGVVRFRGKPLEPAVMHEVRREVAYVGQEPVLGAGTVRQALELPFAFEANLTRRPIDDDLAAALASVGLGTTILDSSTADISGGEKQRVAIARALLLRRSLLVLDEPTSALDTDTADVVLNRLLGDGVTVLAVSHDPRQLALFDRELRMERGRVVGAGATTSPPADAGRHGNRTEQEPETSP